MSDEQKMPIDRLDTELTAAGEDMWMIEEVKRDDGPYVLYADHLATIATLRGAMDAQDGRERAAGARCGVDYNIHGCDWPDAVADEVIHAKRAIATLTAERDARDKKVRELVEAVEAWERCDSTLTAAKVNAGLPGINLAKVLLDEAEREVRTALAQLKEASDERTES